MATSNSTYWWLYGAPVAAGGIRAVIGTPLDAVATREILLSKTTLQVVHEMEFYDYWRGFQPNLLKFVTRTPLNFVFVNISSSAVPTHLDPGIRGVALGVLVAGMETGTINGANALRTRFIQGEGWVVLKKEGLIVLTKGLSAAFAHRALSSAIFFGTYEKLKSLFPKQGAVVSTISGIIQVLLTAPFYIAAIHKQDKKATPTRLDRLMAGLYRTRGFSRGLFLPALAPRLVHSVMTSAPLLWLMEKLQLIHRKT